MTLERIMAEIKRNLKDCKQVEPMTYRKKTEALRIDKAAEALLGIMIDEQFGQMQFLKEYQGQRYYITFTVELYK